MLMKTTYALIAALVLASTSTAFARAPRQTGVEQNGYPYSYNPNEEMRLDHAKGDIW
jgi:hypothetical protein